MIEREVLLSEEQLADIVGGTDAEYNETMDYVRELALADPNALIYDRTKPREGELVRWMFMNIPGYGGAALGKTEDDPIVYFVNDGCMNQEQFLEYLHSIYG